MDLPDRGGVHPIEVEPQIRLPDDEAPREVFLVDRLVGLALTAHGSASMALLAVNSISNRNIPPGAMLPGVLMGAVYIVSGSAVARGRAWGFRFQVLFGLLAILYASSLEAEVRRGVPMFSLLVGLMCAAALYCLARLLGALAPRPD